MGPAQSRAARPPVKRGVSRFFARNVVCILKRTRQRNRSDKDFAIMSQITKVLKDAIDTVATLPEAEQDKIGRELLEHVEKMRALRADLRAGLASLDAGKGRKLDMKEVVARARARHVKP